MSDDELWLQTLAGRTGPAHRATGPAAAPRPAQNEAELLRDAMRRWPAAAPSLAVSAEDIEQLVAAARDAGLLAPRWHLCRACLQRALSWLQALGHWPAGLMTAGVVALLLLGVALPLLLRPAADDDGPALRAPAQAGVQLRQAAQPEAARDALAGRLQALAVPVQRYQRLGRFGLDAELPVAPHPANEALARLLREEGLVVAADGSLRVEYSAILP